ncbi:hypothetical protein [Sinimarinibacterium sp. CAU 1509]|uniref:hypothetical protein n=1 Tax=Sinimarinibacterium sp. CAU 1509 TaxID=2562283 RepID=UPI00146A2048|nr:hypothetical protein [Sinimarinibacterium sp. CAU 1509]
MSAAAITRIDLRTPQVIDRRRLLAFAARDVVRPLVDQPLQVAFIVQAAVVTPATAP